MTMMIRLIIQLFKDNFPRI